MTHQTHIGARAGLYFWIGLGLIVTILGPHPAIKAFGIGMLIPGPMHIAFAAAGGALTAGWDHSASDVFDVVSGKWYFDEMVEDMCDPFSSDPLRRCVVKF